MKKKLLNLQMFAMISHDDAAALIPEEEFKEVFQKYSKGINSGVMSIKNLIDLSYNLMI